MSKPRYVLMATMRNGRIVKSWTDPRWKVTPILRTECAWCKRVIAGFLGPAQAVSHGICKPCVAKLLETERKTTMPAQHDLLSFDDPFDFFMFEDDDDLERLRPPLGAIEDDDPFFVDCYASRQLIASAQDFENL